MKISLWRVFASGVLFAVIAQVVHTVCSFLGMSFYTNPDYFAVWSKIMMPTAGPPPASFYAYSILFGLLGGILFALVYAVLKGGIPVRSIAKRGLLYGFLIFLVGGIPGYLSLILLINLPFALVVLWALETLIIDLLGGIIVAWLNQ